MKNFIKHLVFLLFLLSVLSCAKKETITIVSYNTQTFFDAVNDGVEFKEFRESKNWSEQDYSLRISRLLEALKMCSNELSEKENTPDILVLQEIESMAVVKDICKRLSQKDIYRDFVFMPPQDGGAFSTAILSKHKVTNAKAHNVYSKDKSTRPIVETDILINMGSKEFKITIFGVHWKSKRDGSSNIRKMQEDILYNRMQEKAKEVDYVLACGDFNQTCEEFSKLNKFNDAWGLHDSTPYAPDDFEDNPTLDEDYADKLLPEDSKDITCTGSYCYKGKWEKLDHIFYLENRNSSHQLSPRKFVLLARHPLIFNGEINRYKIGSKQGYSDHLPIGILLQVL